MTKINYKSKTQEKIAAMESEMWDQVKAYLANSYVGSLNTQLETE